MDNYQVRVWHRKEPLFLGSPLTFCREDFQEVLRWSPNQDNIEDVTALLEDAWMLTQNLDEPWNAVTPCRSTAVGDVLEFVSGCPESNRFFAVAGMGFQELQQF